MKKTVYALTAMFFFISVLIQIILLFSLNKNYYHRMHEKLSIVETMDRDKDEVKNAMDSLIDYIQDDKIHLDEDFFNEREILHMVDVKELYLSARKFQFISTFVFFLNLVWLFFKEGIRKTPWFLAEASQEALRNLSYIVLFLFIFFLIDFNLFWNSFHQIFFRNDLWLLNPQTDRMIQMLPGEVFQGLVLRIGLTSLFVFTSLFLLSRSILSRQENIN